MIFESNDIEIDTSPEIEYANKLFNMKFLPGSCKCKCGAESFRMTLASTHLKFVFDANILNVEINII